MTEQGKPVHKIRHRGVAVSIWKNDGAKGPWYSVVARRSCKQGEEWKESDSFGQDDLLLLAHLLQEAHGWIRAAGQSTRQAA
jgi:hypothetical protein